MLGSSRPSINSGDEDEGQGSQLRHYPSTPHLETFRVVSRSASTANPMSNYMQAGMQVPGNPVLSTFSTFAHHKSHAANLQFRDDPNPYKVSDIHIQEHRIQVNDPYRTRSTLQLNKPCSSRSSCGSGNSCGGEEDVYEDQRVVMKLPPKRTASVVKGKMYSRSNSILSNSGGYEVPDPDYGGSSGGSSEDLPLPPDLPPPSDTSEEGSHSLSISASSGGPSPSPVHEDPDSPIPLTPTPTQISDKERKKIEFALRGRKTEIYVADSLANLYYRGKNPTRPSSVGSGNGSSRSSSSPEQDVEWVLKHMGVPVLLLDTGETRARDKRRIQIVLAELGTGLALWKDLVDNLTSYQSAGPFHTMHMSSDHTKVVGLSFDNIDTANQFARQVEKLTSDFANISLSGSKYKNKKEAKNKEKTKMAPKWVRPKKSDIGVPCLFDHISSVKQNDKNLFSSLQHFVRGPGTNNPNTTTTEVSH